MFSSVQGGFCTPEKAHTNYAIYFVSYVFEFLLFTTMGLRNHVTSRGICLTRTARGSVESQVSTSFGSETRDKSQPPGMTIPGSGPCSAELFLSYCRTSQTSLKAT